MNKPRATSYGGRGFNIRFFFNPTEKIIDTIIIEQEKVELFVYIYIVAEK